MSNAEYWMLVFLLGAAREAWTRVEEHTSVAAWHHAVQREMRELGYDTVGVQS